MFLSTYSNIELLAPTCTSAVLEGLDLGKDYTFRIYAENAAGMSEALLGPRMVRVAKGLGNPSLSFPDRQMDD